MRDEDDHRWDRWENQWRRMEAMATDDGAAFAELSLEQQEAYWQRVKREEEAPRDQSAKASN